MVNVEGKPLAGTVSVILGGTGRIGKGLILAHLKAGAKVIVPGRSQEKLAKRASEIPAAYQAQFITIQAQTDNFDEAVALAERIQTEHGTISHVLASIGGWYTGDKITNTNAEAWQRYFVGPVTGHYAIASAMIPRMQTGGSYTLIQGEVVPAGRAKLSLMSMQGSVLDVFWRTLVKEEAEQVRVNVLEIGSTWSDDLSVEEVGQASVAVAQSKVSGQRLQLPHRDELASLIETSTEN